MEAHDPGGKVRLALPLGMEGDAWFSPCGRYRQLLTRRWGEGPAVLWIGMNPSTADAAVDDPTVRKEIGFTRRWGFSAYAKVNVMDYRATDPKDLRKPDVLPRSLRNASGLVEGLRDAALVICCWGALHPKLRPHADFMLTNLRERRLPLFCLGTNGDGSPKHPLYLRSDSLRLPFDTPAPLLRSPNAGGCL